MGKKELDKIVSQIGSKVDEIELIRTNPDKWWDERNQKGALSSELHQEEKDDKYGHVQLNDQDMYDHSREPLWGV